MSGKLKRRYRLQCYVGKHLWEPLYQYDFGTFYLKKGIHVGDICWRCEKRRWNK